MGPTPRQSLTEPFFQKYPFPYYICSFMGPISLKILEPKGLSTLFFMQHGYMNSPGDRKVLLTPKFLPPYFRQTD